MSVGQGLGAVVGGVIGFFAGGGPGGALQGASYGAAIGGALDPADVPGYDGPRLADASEQTSGYGVGLVEANGKIKVSGHVVWIENNRRKEIVTKEDSGGKGGGGSQETTTYSYTGTFMVMLADHKIQAIQRIWDTKGLLVNNGSTDNGTAIVSGDIFPLAHFYDDDSEEFLKAALLQNPQPGPKGQVRLYPGFDDQMPDPRMEADLGVGNCPAYRGCAYLVFFDWPLPQEYGQSIAGSNITAEILVGGTSDTPTLLDAVVVETVPDADGLGVCNYLTHEQGVQRINNWSGSLNSSFPGSDGLIHRGVFRPTQYSRIEPKDETGSSGRSDPQIGITDDESFYIRGPFWGSSGVVASSGFSGSNGQFVAKNNKYAGAYYSASARGVYAWEGYSLTGATYLATGGIPYAIAMDDDEVIYVLFNGSIKTYDRDLTELSTLSVTFPGSAFQFSYTSGTNLMRWADGLLYITYNTQHVYTMPADLSSGPVYLCDLTEPADPSTRLERYSNFYVSGPLLTRFISGTSSGNENNKQLFETWLLPVPDGDGDDLAAVVRARMERSELIEPGDIDVTELSGTVRGYKTQGVGSVRAQIEPLMMAHHFVLIQDGYQIKSVPRGGSSVITIDKNDLDARPYGNASGDALIQSREMDTQLPSVVVVRHLDKDRDYEVNEQRSQTMAASSSVNVQELSLAGVFTPDEAAGIAEIIWARRWLERTAFTFSLPPTYSQLQPADVVSLTTDYASYEFFINRANYTVDGRIECEAVLNDSAVYTPNAVGSSGQNTSQTTVAYGGASVPLLLDIPLIQNEYDRYGFPVGLCGYSNTWPGGVISKSTDNGQSYLPLQGFTGPVVAGVVPDAASQNDGLVIDYTTEIVVEMYKENMSVSSITVAQMKSGQNWAAYGAHGRWEILLFANWTDNGDGTATIDTLIRGAKGTEQYTGDHEDYDQFIFLSDADMSFVNVAGTEVGVSRLYKGVTSGQEIDNVAAASFGYTGVNLKPYSPVKLYAVQDGADWDITWTRRSRLENPYWNNGTAVPLGEDAESYEIDIMDGSTVARTLTATSEAVTYTEADQITDFGSAQSGITFRVYQISATVGRGYVKEATV